MKCSLTGCTKQATVHVKIGSNASLPFCQEHAVAEGWLNRRSSQFSCPSFQRATAAPPTLLSVNAIWEPLRSKSAAKRFFHSNSLIFLGSPPNRLAAVYESASADLDSIDELISKLEFQLNESIRRYYADRSVIEEFLDSLDD